MEFKFTLSMASLLPSCRQLLTECLHHQASSQSLGSSRTLAPLDQELDSYVPGHKHGFQGVFCFSTPNMSTLSTRPYLLGFTATLGFLGTPPDYISQTPLTRRVIMGQSSSWGRRCESFRAFKMGVCLFWLFLLCQGMNNMRNFKATKAEEAYVQV